MQVPEGGIGYPPPPGVTGGCEPPVGAGNQIQVLWEISTYLINLGEVSVAPILLFSF